MGKAKKPFVDYYELLGVSQEATQEEVKAAYREKALEHHPDQNPDPDSHAAFVALHEAYRVLNDPDARSRYDYRYFSQKSNYSKDAGLAQRRELTRAKRSARYSRRMYSPRMRYRSSYSGPSRPAAPRSRPTEKRPPDPGQTTKSDRKIIDEHEASLLGFRYYNQVVRFVLLGILMFSLGMVADYFTAVQTSEETLTSKEPVMWTLGTPNMVKIKSVYSSAVIPKGEARWVEPGAKFTPYKTLFAGEVTKVIIQKNGEGWYVTNYGGIYGSAFPWIALVIITALGTLFFRKNEEFNAYLGTIALLLAVIIFPIIFK